MQGSNENDDEGLDEDNSVDVVDPWGVVNKPFRVMFCFLYDFDNFVYVYDCIKNKNVPIRYGFILFE